MVNEVDGMSSLHACSEGLPVPQHLLLGESSTLDEVFMSGQTAPVLLTVDRSPSVNTGGDKDDSSYEIPLSPPSSTGTSCYQVSLSSMVVISLTIFLVIVCRQYVKDLLVWLENADPSVSCVIFIVLFTAVSFPMVWGYLLLMLASGYLYGLLFGPMLVAFCGTFGILVAHIVMKNFCRNFIMMRFYNDQMEAVIRVVESQQGFKVVALTRLTPIPFGLQNSLFALTDISVPMYCLASLLGLLPTSVLNCYMGSTLRSMEDVLSDESNQTTGYIIFIIQILLTVALLCFVVRKARVELKKTVDNEGSRYMRTVESGCCDIANQVAVGCEMDICIKQSRSQALKD